MLSGLLMTRRFEFHDHHLPKPPDVVEPAEHGQRQLERAGANFKGL